MCDNEVRKGDSAERFESVIVNFELNVMYKVC